MIKTNYFGLDVGEKTIGIAFSQGFYAQPFKTVTFERDDYENAINQLVTLIFEQNVGHVIISFPKHMNNDIGQSAQRALMIESLLKDRVDASIIMWDERLSSKEANRRMLEFDVSRKKRKQKIDQVAAVIILQSYLDSHERK